MNLMVKDIDAAMTNFIAFDKVEDMPDKWRMACTMLDAAANDEGRAQVDYFGSRATMRHTKHGNVAVVYHLCTTFRFVYVWYGKHDQLRTRCTNEKWDGGNDFLAAN